MDSITQAALGAAIGHSMLGEKLGNKAAIIGAVVATIPDLDVILYAFYSPFEMLSIHRGFSHSVVFSFIGAFILTLLLARFRWTSSISSGRLFLFTWLSLITHMILDAWTAYGTQLLLPFSNSRLGLDSINVVDPAYSVPLILGLILSLVKRRSRPNHIGLIVSSLYLLVTLGLKHTVVEDLVAKDLQESNIAYIDYKTIPVGMGSIYWYGIAKNADSLYLKEFSLLEKTNTEFTSFPINEHLLDKVDADITQRMRWFSKGLYTVAERDSTIRFFNLQVDMRGVVDDGTELSPTAGYFELSKDANGNWQVGSRTVTSQ